MASAGAPTEGTIVSHVGVLALLSGVLIALAARKLARRG
jgi:hypothetical protein